MYSYNSGSLRLYSGSQCNLNHNINAISKSLELNWTFLCIFSGVWFELL